MPEHGTEQTPQDDAVTFDAALTITATAYATHPEGAVVPAADDPDQE